MPVLQSLFRRRLVLGVFAALGALACWFFWSARVALHPVRGQLFVAREPAEGALVVFHPLDAAGPKLLPSARVGKDGAFTLGTRAPGDGAPAGAYAVAISWTFADKRPNPVTGEVPVRLHPRYADPRLSPFRVQVKKGNN